MCAVCWFEVLLVFHAGAPLYGDLEFSGMGLPRECQPAGSADALQDDCARSNEKLISAMHEDKHANELLAQTLEDANLGRMSYPVPAERCDLNTVRLHPRFSVEQGTKSDGSLKIRAIDNMSWCAKAECDASIRLSKKRLKEGSINGHCEMPECQNASHTIT